MRHHSKRALTDKQNVLNKQNSTRRSKVQPCSTGISVPYHSLVSSKNETTKHYTVPHKMKRLKTIKERNQIRRQTSNRFNQHCDGKSKDKRRCSDYQDCQCSCSMHFSRKEKPVAKPFPAQKPSIITEGRLTSIRGLFSHEVRSVDIERLVKEKKDQMHIEKIKGRQTTASNSPTSCVVPHSTPLVVISETSEEGISACANKEQKSLTADPLQSRLHDTMHSADNNYSSTQTPKATDNTSLPDQKGMQEAVIMSPSENHPVQKSFPASFKISQVDHTVNSKNKNTQNKTNKITAAVGANNDFVHSESLVTPTGLEALHLDVPQFDSSPNIFLFSSPTLEGEKKIVGKCSSTTYRNDMALSFNTAYTKYTRSRVHGGRIFHTLQRKNIQITHKSVSAIQENMKMINRRKQWNFRQVCKSPPNHCLREGFSENANSGGASKRQRKQTQEVYSLQDFVTKLQRPCRDTLSQWSITAQSTKQHCKSQTFSLHQDFTKSQTSPCSYRLDQILEPFFSEPQKQIKTASAENRRRNSTALPLLEQWRNDPDLNFLFQEETSLKTRTSLGPLAELRNRSPNYDSKRIVERQLFGASSSVSSFFPPEGFCYEPYYRFPHPSNSFNRSEKSMMSLYTPPDFEKRNYDLSQHLTSPYFNYRP
ncbi:hypothetical protein Baya_13770 [Bagarius yarrelli]|uniref:Uncharacterized protein n=1 Tax=Bagarius yarrelli TaxID=175774 RepID=A0A556V8Q5_BAGYA|nr:hypothetical protein Baya_13770 [Bagarius yarrelli]